MFHSRRMWFQTMSCVLVALLSGGAGTYSSQALAAGAAISKADPRSVPQSTAPADVKKRREEGWAKLRRHSNADAREKRAKEMRAKAMAMHDAPERKLERAFAQGEVLKKPDAQLRADAEKASPAFAAALRKPAHKTHPNAFKRVDYKEPRPKQLFKAGVRMKAGARGELPPETKALYAQVSGQGVWVAHEFGATVPVETVLRDGPASPFRSGLASAGDLLSTLDATFLGALPPPAPEDTAETPETRRSPELLQLTTTLGNKPLNIYNWVRTQIAPELYYGSKKGAAATLAQRGGNDFDTASLLITLLRNAGYPARYEYGLVDLTEPQAVALTGAKNISAAFKMLSKVSPVALSPDGKTLQMERAWVRAYVPYRDGPPVWIRLDANMKRVSYTPAVNLSGLVHFDFDGYLSTVRQDSPQAVYEAQLLAAAKAKNLCNTLDDALSKARIVQDNFKLLPAEHPGHVISDGLLVFARPPANFRHVVSVDVDGKAKSFELAELEGRQVVLRYPGATAADVSAIQAAGGMENVTPYRVQVKPTLVVDGVEVGSFDPVAPGTQQTLSIQVDVPGGNPALAVSRPVAGSPYAVLVAGGSVPTTLVDTLRKSLGGKTGDDKIEAQSLLALYLWAQKDESAAYRMYGFQGHAAFKDAMIGTASRRLGAATRFGMPIALTRGNYVIDITRNTLTPLPRDGNDSQVAELVKLSGYHGSFLEHQAWEEVLSTPAVSTIRILQASHSQSVPVYTLASASSPDRTKLTGYDVSTYAEIDQALAAGWKALVPERPINYGRLQDAEGYILENPVDGSGVYRIGSLLNGGESDGGDAQQGPTECPTCKGSEGPVGSIVNFANGNWRETFTDLSLPGVGLPIVWARHYASRAQGMSELGYGWQHSYGMHLRLELNGDVTYVQDDWREARFTNQAGTFKAPPGWHHTLTLFGDGYLLRDKHGLVFEFDSAGNLTAQMDPSGNRVTVLYSNGLLSQVKDAMGQVALTFEHQGNKISKVTDRAGRVVRYAYNGDDLTHATDVLSHPEAYAYDGDHNLTLRTDKTGQVWKNYYDFQDRWVGGENPLGAKNSVSYDVVNRRTTYIDRTGAVWQHEHNETGSPLAVVNPLGDRTEATWDNDFNKLSEKDARGNETAMAYDAQGNLFQRTEPDGQTYQYQYNSEFNRVIQENPGNLSPKSYAYDSAGRLLSSTDSLGTTTYGYDSRGQLQQVTAPGSAVTSFAHDGNGSVKTLTDPQGGTTTLGYDATGHLTSTTDGLGNTRTMEVDASGRVLAQLDAEGARTDFTYDNAGRRLTAKDAAGSLTRFAYDGAGRLTAVTDALGNVSRTEYDAEGRITALTDSQGRATRHQLDSLGRVTQTRLADGASTGIAYCADVGTACASIDGLGNITLTEFDKMGRPIKVTDALGRVTSQTYDNAGRLASMIGPNQPATTYSYQDTRISGTTVPSGPELAYGYDERGNRTSVTANGQSTLYTFDKANRLLSETNPLGKTTSYTYDAAGNRRTKTDGNGKTTTYVYDKNRRLMEVQFHDGTKYQYAYDSRGHRTLEKSPSHERHLTYDALGRVQKVEDITFGKVIEYGYDALGNRTSLTEGDELAQHFTYDAMNRLRQADDGEGHSISFEYDAAGRRTRLLRSNGVTSRYTYDSAGQLLSIVHAKGTAELLRLTYGYSPEGLRLSKETVPGIAETYGYDTAHRLTQVQYGLQRRVTYTLDGLGNATMVQETTPAGALIRTTTSTFNAFNQLENAQTTLPTGAEPQRTYAYDGNGNQLSEISSSGGTTFGWDPANRLRQVTTSGVSFSYDGNGLRIGKVESGNATNFLIDGGVILQEFDNDGSVLRAYVNHPQVMDDVLALSMGNQLLYPLQDAIGSIVATTDSNGALDSLLAYDVYGQRTSSGSTTSRGFTGREHDSSSLTFYRSRYVDPATGRFLSADPLGLIDGPNRYAYAQSNPVDRIDPWGTKVVRPFLPEHVADKQGNLTDAARLYQAFEGALLGTQVGFLLYLTTQLSSLTVRPVVARLPERTAGLSGPKKLVEGVTGTIWGAQNGEYIVALSFKNVDVNNRDPSRLFNTSDGEVMVHEFQHAADAATDKYYSDHDLECRAFAAQNKYRQEHDLPVLSPDIINRLLEAY